MSTFKSLAHPPSTTCEDAESRRPCSSEHVASMFSGWRAGHRQTSAIADSSGELWEDDLSVRTYIRNFCYSHPDEAGKPWGSTRGPRGRPRRPPDGSDGQGVGHADLRGGEGVNNPRTSHKQRSACETSPTKRTMIHRLLETSSVPIDRCHRSLREPPIRSEPTDHPFATKVFCMRSTVMCMSKYVCETLRPNLGPTFCGVHVQ